MVIFVKFTDPELHLLFQMISRHSKPPKIVHEISFHHIDHP